MRELKGKIIEEFRRVGKAVNIPQVEARYQSLIREREIRDNIARLKQTGGTVEYHSLDVRDAKQFKNLIEKVYEKYGKVDVVVHGAGVIEDALLKDKDTESFKRVFETKVDSAITLLDSLKLDSVQYLFLLSSVVGRTGNAGQSDYVAANEVLNKMAIKAQKQMSGRCAALLWGPWRAGMAQPELEAIFAQYGWAMIDVAAGSKAFIDEMHNLSKNESEVLIVAEPANKDSIEASGARLQHASLRLGANNVQEYILDLDIQVDAFLMDHAFDGVTVLPMAYALELMCEAACASYPHLSLQKIENFDVLAGILFHSPRKKLSITVQEQNKDNESVSVMVSIISGETKRRENFRGVFTMSTTANDGKLPVKIPVKLNEAEFDTGSAIIMPTVGEVYKQWLFHGPRFHGVQSIEAAGDAGIWGRVSGLSADRCLNIPTKDNWLIDPVMFDSAMQLAGIWTRRSLDITVLPTGFTRLTMFVKPDCHTGDVFTAYVLVSPSQSKNELTCNLAIYKQSGELCVLVEGLSGAGSKSLNRLGAQGNIVQASTLG